MKLRDFFTLAIFLLLLLLQGCGLNSNSTGEKKSTSKVKTVTAPVHFRAFDKERVLPGVKIVVIGSDGLVNKVLVTDSNGEAEKTLTVPVDPTFSSSEQERGTVTCIAFKKGYRETVLLEVPVSSSSAAQPFLMEPMIEGERNEPRVEFGNTHRLDIISLVQKYAVSGK